MPQRVRLSRCVILLCSGLVLAASGCGGGGSKKSKIWVYQIPDFYQADLKRVAVVPFGNRTAMRGVGGQICDKISGILTNNGTYEVYTRQHLKDVLKEQDAVSAGILEADEAIRIGKLKAVQVLICGVVNRYETDTRSETRYNQVPVFGRDAAGNAVITGFRQVPYVWTRHDAFVECQVVVIDTTTGQQIAAFHNPSNIWASGSPPEYGPAEVLRAAEEDQVAKIVQAIAVTRTQIKLKGSVLKTATELYDQEWTWEKEFTPQDEQFYVVVKLPAEADRNNFKITIIPKDGREVMAEQALVWSKQYERYGYIFKVKPIFDQGGFGEYSAKLYSGPEPIARYDFKIVEER